MTIQLFKPKFDVELILSELRPILESGWVGLGPKTAELEAGLAEYLCAEHVVATSSCTAALQLALHALYLPKGSTVLTTPISFASTAMVCLNEGLEVQFCDVEPLTGNLDAGLLEEAIARFKPKALMVVHVGGYPCDMLAIDSVARAYGLPVIEDCAHALGSSWRGLPVGSGDNVYCYSFHAVKNLPTADGGAVATSNKVVADRLRRLRWFGIDRSTADRSGPLGGYSWEYEIDEVGFKAHMNDLQATLGLVGMRTLDEGNRRRRAIARRYIKEIHAATPPSYSQLRTSSGHFLPLFFERRDAVIHRLEAAKIQYGMHYKPLYKFRPFAGAPLKGTEWYASHELTLPMHLGLSDDDVSRVVDAANYL